MIVADKFPRTENNTALIQDFISMIVGTDLSNLSKSGVDYLIIPEKARLGHY